ncbi:MAG: hypothetical protein K2F63_06605, partial [Muribaculaceae bacterium]|nr:hypothetical protein [Muribaculaceae bacterium]
MEIEGFISAIAEKHEFEKLCPLAMQALDDYDRIGRQPSLDVCAMVTHFLGRWRGHPDADPQHIDTVEAWDGFIKRISAERAEQEWRSLFDDDGCLLSAESLKKFIDRYPGNAHIDEADDLLWEWALAQEDPEAGIRVYENYTAGSGRHAGDLAEMATASQEWHTLLSAPPAPRYAASTKACGIIDFLQSNPRHMFAKKAMSMLKDLGPAVCAEIAENPIVYYPNLFDKLYDSGLFNRQDLLKAANANDYLLGRITDRQAIQRRLDALNLDGIMSDMLHGYGEKGITDILFFGISSSGKTCILSGLLNNDGLSFDTVNFSCKYAQALKSYAEEGFAPPATRDVAVAVIKASTSRKGLKYHFNLVDMAGEAFVHKIADNIDAKTDFRDMGQGAPEVLNNGNDKVFFIVVDPAASPDDQTLQRNVLR